MHITKKNTSPTKLSLTIVADQAILDEVKQQTLRDFRQKVTIQGFRSGKAPLGMVEKHVDPAQMQTEFVERAVNRLYIDALTEENIRPVSQPQITIQKFVPFTVLEFAAELEVIGTVKLPDYTKIKLAAKSISVSAKDVDDVLANLKTRAAERTIVERPAKNGDEVVLDFTGQEAETKQSISGADGKDYPLVLGSDAFIPGFEKNLAGMKAGDEKSFTLTFPKDYGVAALQDKKVIFTVKVSKVQAIEAAKIDDAFAAKVGPFKTVADLKTDIKKQLTAERQTQADREYENELITKITEKSDVAVPAALIDEELDRLEKDERQNLVYRGQTWQEHLDAEGVTEAEHREQNRTPAEARVKAGLVLSEIAEKEKLDVTAEELDARMQQLKGQYTDQTMQAELDKPESRREIASRLLTEKTILKLHGYAKEK